jgi:hypothetical protein
LYPSWNNGILFDHHLSVTLTGVVAFDEFKTWNT